MKIIFYADERSIRVNIFTGSLLENHNNYSVMVIVTNFGFEVEVFFTFSSVTRRLRFFLMI